MKECMYYEIIAGAILSIDPEDMFTKSRKGNVPIARQFCMSYRNNEIKMEQKEAGARYGKDHATVIHANKTIKNRCQTNKQFKSLWTLFISMCDIERKKRQSMFTDAENPKELNYFLLELDKRHTLMMYQLYTFTAGAGDESGILINIKNYQNDLGELYKILSKNDN